MGQRAADSDIRMMIATQVAYLDGDENMSVGELIHRIISNYAGCVDLSEKQKAQLETAGYIKSQIEEHDLQDCYRWIIQAVCDENAKTGFYGCLIDTRDGEAILGFRGSEMIGNQGSKDWIETNLALLNGISTRQHRSTEEFTRYIYDRYGDAYHHYNFTGHSLGGNLAEHAAITAPDGMPIHRCMNLDGPGYSDEYIFFHGPDILRNGQYIDHYQYSLVGSLLFPLPGTRYRTIRAHNDKESELLSSLIWRHHTRNIEFDENGNVQQGESDFLSDVLAGISSRLTKSVELFCTFCPEFAARYHILLHEVEILLEIKKQAEHLVESVQTELQTLQQNIENWFRNMSGVTLTGEYEININYVTGLGNGMEDVARKLARISRDISEISDKLHYHSLSGSYYKSRLKNIDGSVNRNSRKALALGEAACNCAQYCAGSDAQVAQIYREG